MDAQDANREIEQLRAANKQLEGELKSEREKLEALVRDRWNRNLESWIRLGLAAYFALTGLLFLSGLTLCLLRATGTADEVLATVFGIAALWTVLVVVVFRWLGTRR